VNAHWYVIHTYSGQEARAKQALVERARQFGKQDAIEEIFIPEEDVVEVVKGQRKTSKRKFLPGYILVRMKLDDEVWHIVKNTAKITGFVGPGGARPSPVSDEDVARMLGQTKTEKPTPKVTFAMGEDVRVIHGPFANFTGSVSEVRPEKEQVQVMVAVFGRSTPVWLSYEHVEKV
jgi:transcription termination/antitermination protein NusG